MASRGMDRSVRQTIPSVRRRARSSPRSSSVSSDMRPVTKLDAQDLIEAEREYQRQQELEKCASDLAMEAMEYKFLSRRKRLMARKLLRESRDTSDPEMSRQSVRPPTRLDSNGNIIGTGPTQRLPVQRSVAPDLALQISTRMDFCEPELLLEKLPGAGRESTSDQSVRSKHDREMKKYEDSEGNGRKRSRFTANLIRTHTSESDAEPEDSGYEAKSGITDTTSQTMDPSRTQSRGSFSSSLRPFSSDFESAWGSQELLESDSSVRKKSSKSRSSDEDREHDMFQDAEESLDSVRQYGDFEAGGIETPANYEIIDLPPTRIDAKDKANPSDKSKDSGPKPMLQKQRRPLREGRRSTSDPVRDRLSALPGVHLPSTVRRGSTAMPYHFAMPTVPVTGYMKPTVASLRARYEREESESGGASARDRYKISEEDNYRIEKAEELRTKKLDEDKSKRYEEWLKKLDEVNVIPQSAKERVKKLEDELFRLKKATQESESQMARMYRRRLVEEPEESEHIFAMSRKTQNKPEYQMKMISRSTQTDDKERNDVSVNTDIDYRLMSALLDKLLVAKTTVGVQTDWKNDVVETREASVSTDRIFRERFSALPQTRSMSAQTEVSALKYKDESVATDPEITGHRHRTRSVVREVPAVQRSSSSVQTDQKWISRKDVGVEANLSSFSSESEDSVVVSTPYPKGFHPKTGQLLDESLLPNYQEISEQNNRYAGVRVRETPVRTLKTPEPIIEEFGSSSSASSESNSEGDYSCENVREVYREKFSEYKSGTKPAQKSYYHMRTEEKKFFDGSDLKKQPKGRQLLDTDFQHYDREPHRPEFRHKFTAEKRPDSRQEVPSRSAQPMPIPPQPKSVPMMRSIETQTNGQVMAVSEQSVPQTVTKSLPKDLRTESKITVEVTKANKKERSEVRSMTKMDELTGKMSRTTHVTTSKHVPIGPLSATNSMREISGGLKTPSSTISSPQRSLSPMRKAQSEINVTPVSNISTRPSSADDLSMGPTQAATKIPSTLSFGSSYPSRSSLKTPSPTFKHYNSDEINVPRVGRVSIQDPLHMVVLAPPESFDNKRTGLVMPIDKNRWRETSSSTICNEMTTDAFKDEDGTIQKPKTISMSTETLIESKGNESSVKTRSRTARKYSNEAEEKAITNETSFDGPGGILNDLPYIESEPTSRSAYCPPQRTSSSPVVTLIDTPEFLSPEPTEHPIHKSRSAADMVSDRSRVQDRDIPSLITDVRSSRLRPEEELNKRLVQNTSRKAAVVEPVQHYQTVIKGDTCATPATPVRPTTPAPPTEIVTRIIRTSELDKSKKFTKSKTVLEQELQSGRDGRGGGCHISSTIAFDGPNHQNNRGVIIKELNEDGTSKDGSTDTLDQRSGEIVTETQFQSYKSPKRAPNGMEETSWKYSMECNCLNGSNTTVRTTIDYKRIQYPLTSYETSL